MLEGFEEAFADAQSRVVSLCLELLKNSEKKADKIYIYLFQNDDEDYIDAFLKKKKICILQVSCSRKKK